MTDDDIDKMHDNIDCWSGYGLGARFDYRAFARKVEAAERKRCADILEREACGWIGELRPVDLATLAGLLRSGA